MNGFLGVLRTLAGWTLLAAASALVVIGLQWQAPERSVVPIGEKFLCDGYPDRLAGEQIPIGSRIIAVAAAFVAMITDRPHAAARSVDDTLAELERCSGTQFDPTVVSAFAKSVSRLGSQR